MRILFILKQQETPNMDVYAYGRASGLRNSVAFCDHMLKSMGYDSRVVVVIDHNCIDREVSEFKPDLVFLEALWVIPEKLGELANLHPKVKWNIRLHSHVPFLSGEGIAMSWIIQYLQYPNVQISTNNHRAFRAIKPVIENVYGKTHHRVVCLPNYYVHNDYEQQPKFSIDDAIHIGCFGAIRPYKNQLIQALAAITYADQHKKKLYFHINGNRIEGAADAIKKNLVDMFKKTSHELVEHGWLEHGVFLSLLSRLDLGMQVSYTETFNIVSADMLRTKLPFVASKEISWASSLCQADCNDLDDIVNVMNYVTRWPKFVQWMNEKSLTKHLKETRKSWKRYLDYV